MEHIAPFDQELNLLSNNDLLIEYNKKSKKVSPLPFFPIFAKRIDFFKDLIFKEVIDEKNTVIKFRAMKTSWLIILSILDYCEEEKILKDLINHIKRFWDKDDFNDFAHYISKEDRFKKYF